MARSKKERKEGLIKKSKALTVTYSPEGIATYTCNQNKVNAQLHPIFGSRHRARKHIMELHFGNM